MAVFTQGGRVALAKALLDMTFFLAIGQGDPAWDSVPPPATPEEQAALDAAMSVLVGLDEFVGVTRTRDKYFVAPDPDGAILMADGARYSQSSEATQFVYVRFQLDLADASGTTLREAGIYINTVLDSAVPGGQTYIPASQITQLGSMIEVDRFAPIIRDGSIGQTFSFILTT
ncbi:hypothetical protein I6H96_02405 [Brucella anthropi]|uniref:Uncharacterized protein n=1 Tax=Brucella anthropi (strain ATCC 49188 / DSM 6882 / CCUG 24695 / JCM 21032 / LMG 3331 / NBRC 15819 / NCTC 12168 / Alc 37) TaxID=439375 RepID=A6WZ09_BRUA4|nr:hypothetical protein [Brucella anthropi]ABS14213.1 conserved hypothetical protein [Brucella anthropi ATCC 49188]NKC48106.1 hypothetical protein [Brucella anthropi ATCC 49188]QQC25735.1 hypothetical protein I6H96_02405 [Brucella anthropi]RRY08800.1 hypothetical protein EGJ58_12935 [Brucella anthropi]SUA65596.1 Uncharacterised protein [Brucella anthropi]